MESYKLVIFLAFCITLCYAKVDAGSNATSTVPPEKQTYVVSSSIFPSDLSWNTGFGQALIFVGAAAFSFVLIGGLTLLLAPLFGYKVCAILGNCNKEAITYSAEGTLQNPAQSNTYNNDWGTAAPYFLQAPYTTYGKRSVEYIKPILETLAKTYEQSKRR
ncbi:uncharacterized protein LOC135844173 [Planococcus citri]|uniref:uncharacterized protein LOC135844173 n=1 Tax=Planococcus citri TaxID=170843 RepID=UPI0031F79C87